MRPARYMGGGGGFLPPFDASMWSARLAIAAAVLFVLSLVAGHVPYLGAFLQHAFVFVPAEVFRGSVWQLVTYTVFDSGDVLWTMLSILFFWSFGNTVEQQLGSRRFLLSVFGYSGVGAVLTCLVALVWPATREFQHVGLPVAFTTLTIMFAELNPDTPILFGLLIPIGGRWLVWATLAMLVLLSLQSSPIVYLPEFGAFAAVELHLRAGGGVSPRRWYLQFRAWRIEQALRRKARNFTLIPGEKDSKPKPPDNGYLH